ncbi:MAG TPA: hypothetical protein VK488_03095 [Gaiellaceae bacterium]|nr:hypothetical protein [Gaiellaceae bacterium]
MVTANALRLSALVAVAMASGYLWRGAVEVRRPVKALRAEVPAIAFELPDAPFRSLGHLHVSVPGASSPVAKRRGVARAPQRSAPASRSGAAQLIAVESKHPSRLRAAKPKPPPESRRPKPPPAPPPLTPAPPPPPVSPPDPAPPPQAGVETRPGRGKGDKKHSRTGPRRHERKQKKEKAEKPPKAEKEDQGGKKEKPPKVKKDDRGEQGKEKGKKEKK